MSVQVTLPNYKQAIETRDRINRDYPKQAYIRDNCCYISQVHSDYCKDYVVMRCRIRKEDNNGG